VTAIVKILGAIMKILGCTINILGTTTIIVAAIMKIVDDMALWRRGLAQACDHMRKKIRAFERSCRETFQSGLTFPDLE
jgi:uncharacterized oligopeptide transporter (OPT) family protein